jgi:hypothetical protein
MAEIKATEKMFRNNMYYSSVSAKKIQVVYRAISREFFGTKY